MRKIFRHLSIATAAFAVSAAFGQDVISLFEKAQDGDAQAQYELANCYLKGNGVKKDPAKAFTWYKQAAAQGHERAKMALDMLSDMGLSTPNPTPAATPTPAPQHDQSEANQLFQQGVRCLNEKNYTEAAKLFKAAADQGHAQAQFYLGCCYDNGQGVPQNQAEAAKWYKLAADQGYADAQLNLGVCYANGEGVPQDFAEAVKWLRLAAEQGLEEAQEALKTIEANADESDADSSSSTPAPQDEQSEANQLFRQGISCHNDKNYTEAVKYFKAAADQGHAAAQLFIGFCYAKGDGVPQDLEEAAKWFKLSAEQGVAHAQYVLGLSYKYAQGVPQNRAEAAKWLKKAAEQGYEDAAEELKEL